jgi:hypothetical protein
MGVDLMLVFDDGSAEVPAPGKPTYAFLSGLTSFCSGLLEHKDEYYKWYAQLNDEASVPLCEVSKPLLDAQFTYEYCRMEIFHYSELQYATFSCDVPDSGLTEDTFKYFVREGKIRWSKIEDCIRAVRFLLLLFKQVNPRIMEGYYRPEDTIPGYEELLELLETARKQNYAIVQFGFF